MRIFSPAVAAKLVARKEHPVEALMEGRDVITAEILTTACLVREAFAYLLPAVGSAAFQTRRPPPNSQPKHWAPL